MDVDLALLCDAATVDAAGKLNILGVFDRIQVASFPARHGRLSLVVRFRGDLGDVGPHALRIRLVGPDGGELFGADGKVELSAGPTAGAAIRVPRVLNFDGLVFEAAGRYTFDLLVDGVHEVSIPLTVVGPRGAQA